MYTVPNSEWPTFKTYSIIVVLLTHKTEYISIAIFPTLASIFPILMNNDISSNNGTIIKTILSFILRIGLRNELCMCMTRYLFDSLFFFLF